MDVPAREARARFAALVELAARGECVTITRYGKPVAELRPLPAATRSRSAADPQL
jgi:prevent-host-death family protein